MEDRTAIRFDRLDYDKVQSKSMVSSFLPPPNITGSQHIGHALNQSVTDAFLRFRFLNGTTTILWSSGLDHAGIASQVVVSKSLRKKHPDSLISGRCLNENIWEWYYLLKWAAYNQVHHLKLSINWFRSHFTFSTGTSNCLKETFSRLDAANLVYKAERLINWDPALRSVLSDLEVEQRSQFGGVWYLKYNSVSESQKQFVVVCTTRPETLVYDVAVIIHPSSFGVVGLEGIRCVLIPTTNKSVPVVTDLRVSKGLGSRAITTNILKAAVIKGKERCLFLLELKLRGSILYFGRQELGTLQNSRTTDPIVLGSAKQWFLDLKRCAHPNPNHQILGSNRFNNQTLRQIASGAVRTRRTRFLPARWSSCCCYWLRDAEDWCLSRQLSWGHKVTSHLSKSGGDVLDTWFSSAIIPVSAAQPFIQHNNLRNLLPFDVLFTGHDIVCFWVARMLMLGPFCTGQSPFSQVNVHGLFVGSDGIKMSKSRGNVVDPLDILSTSQTISGSGQLVGDDLNADSFRASLISLPLQTKSIQFDHSKLKGLRAFLLKIQSIDSFLEGRWSSLKVGVLPSTGFVIGHAVTPVSRWIVLEMGLLVGQSNKHLERHRWDRMIGGVRDFVRRRCCDKFIEHIKDQTRIGGCASILSDLNVLSGLFISLLQMLYPVVPAVASSLLNRNDVRMNYLRGHAVPVRHHLLRHPKPAFNSLWDVQNAWAVGKMRAVRKVLGEAFSIRTNQDGKVGTLLINAKTRCLIDVCLLSQLVVEIFVFDEQKDLSIFRPISFKPLVGSSEFLVLLRSKTFEFGFGSKKRGALIIKLLNIPFICYGNLEEVLSHSSKLSLLLGLS
jgi:valyl-tRNA synthetase